MIGPPARPALSADQLQPGQIIDISQIQGSENTFFQEYEILEGDSVYNRIYGKSYYENENIGLQDLRYLKMLHYNFNHEIQVEKNGSKRCHQQRRAQCFSGIICCGV